MQETTSTERIFLSLEQPHYPMDFVGIFVLAPGPEGPLPFEHVRARLDKRSRTLPLLRRKLVTPPLGLGEERWIQAETFTIDDHLHRAEVPAPGDLRALLDTVLEVTAEPLDRGLPLWQAWHLDGYHDDRTVLLLRAHHALIDGMGTMALHAAVFDLHPVPVDLSLRPDDICGEPEPGLVERALRELPDRLSRQVRTSTRLTRAVTEALPDLLVRRPLQLAAQAPPLVGRLLAGEPVELPEMPRFVPNLLDPVPRTPFNAHVDDPTKALAVASISLAEVKQVRRRLRGSTVNDVLLALVTGALRRYLLERGELPDGPLVSTLPVSVRRGRTSAATTEGNQFTTVWIDLPTHLADPWERLQAVHDSATQAKSGLTGAQSSWNVLSDVGDLLLPGVLSAAMGLSRSRVVSLLPPTLNLTISNLVGAPVRLYFAGREVEAMHARTIVCPPVNLFFHSITYNGVVEFGITTIRQLVEDPDELAQGLHDELALLLEAAQQLEAAEVAAGAAAARAARPARRRKAVDR